MSGHRGSERGGRFGTEIAVDKATHLLLETSVEAGLRSFIPIVCRLPKPVCAPPFRLLHEPNEHPGVALLKKKTKGGTVRPSNHG